MKTKNGFTLIESISEIGSYLKSKSVSRAVSKIQIHHMALPDYNTWKNTDTQKWDEPWFGRTESLNDYGKNTWGSKDDNGKYIAQHFSIFPDGKITSGRSMNSTPIGITGWNTGAICIETYGNFDKGHDTMNDIQKKALIALVGELCTRFKITPGSSSIRYHGWFSAKGTYLGDYKPGTSTKTCPGTGFFGGNTMAAYNANFLPAIKSYLNDGSTGEPTPVNKLVRITTDKLNVRKEASESSAVVGEVYKGDVFTIVEISASGSWGKLKSGLGWIGLYYTEDVNIFTEYQVIITTADLNVRKEPNASSAITTVVHEGDVFTIVEENNGWGKLKSGAGWINLYYTKKR